MLFCKYLRGSHKRAHKSVFHRVPDKRGGYKRLTAADITLNEPVHRLARLHIAKRIGNRSPLRICRSKWEGRPKIIKLKRLHPEAVCFAVSVFHPT